MEPAAALTESSWSQLRLSHILSSLSLALDLAEGLPLGHTVRTCVIGMRIAEKLHLPADVRSDLFYTLLLKDAGCSSNAARYSRLFDTEDQVAKGKLRLSDWPTLPGAFRYLLQVTATERPSIVRAWRIAGLCLRGPAAARRLLSIRCERGAEIAALLEFRPATQEGIRHLDEHVDGLGFPSGLKGDEIPLISRIACVAQAAEIYAGVTSFDEAFSEVERRSGTWFDPEVVRALDAARQGAHFWRQVAAAGDDDVAALEPQDQVPSLTEQRVDQVTEAFSQIIDAKSPFTHRHSEGVTAAALGMARALNFDDESLLLLKHAALLHDLGKLAVPNTILDKAGPLTDAELRVMKRHPAYTEQILSRLPAFRSFSAVAAAHHERMDGKGYHRGLKAGELPLAARLLPVADVFDALTSDRPYRQAMLREDALALMEKDIDKAFCKIAFSALKHHLGSVDGQVQ